MDARVAWISSGCQLINKTVTLTVDVIHLRLLSEDLVAEWQHALVSVPSD